MVFAVASSALLILAALLLLLGCCPSFVVVVVRGVLVVDVLCGMDENSVCGSEKADDPPARVLSCFEYGMAAEVGKMVAAAVDT